uniref:Triacylglycerol lipase n=1 Tax=Arcella intermedia TaxID=1963864 RepID=A0A6B2LLB3_9EUKA
MTRALPEDSSRIHPFNCTPTGRSPQKPTDARDLLPADIDIIMAMGDSLTAGFGADSTHLFNLFVDYRGSSFSVGGAKSIDECSTLANILQVYNRNITGYSTGAGEAEEKAKLNVAVTGSRSRDLLKQVHVLRDRLQAYDMKQWKMLTIFIGSNDLCGSCFDPLNSAEHFVANLEVPEPFSTSF